jgi:hypothetical protein
MRVHAVLCCIAIYAGVCHVTVHRSVAARCSWLPGNYSDQAGCSCMQSIIVGGSFDGHHAACRGVLLALGLCGLRYSFSQLLDTTLADQTRASFSAVCNQAQESVRLFRITCQIHGRATHVAPQVACGQLKFVHHLRQLCSTACCAASV